METDKSNGKPDARKTASPVWEESWEKPHRAIYVLRSRPTSRSIKPSVAGEVLTEKIKQVAKYIDVRVLDHLIITAESYFSFADEGIIYSLFL